MKKKVISAILCGAMVLGTVCPVLAAVSYTHLRAHET